MDTKRYENREIDNLFQAFKEQQAIRDDGIMKSLARIEERLNKKDESFDQWKETTINLSNLVSRHNGELLRVWKNKEDKVVIRTATAIFMVIVIPLLVYIYQNDRVVEASNIQTLNH